jgi:ribosomal protein S27E
MDIIIILAVMMFAFIGMFCILGMVLHNEIERDKRRRKRMRIKRDEDGKLNCPNCGDVRFMEGQNKSDNIKCAGCGKKYTLTPSGLKDKNGKIILCPTKGKTLQFFGNEEE